MKKRNRHPGQRCPSCGCKAYVISTRMVSDIHTERYYLCKNDLCAHQFKTLTEITETVVAPLNKQQQDVQKELTFDSAESTS